MEVMDAVVKVGGVVAAGGGIIALLVKLFKWAMAPQEIKARVEQLEVKEENDRRSIQEENALICFALFACLDGLEQLGANHNVPIAKDKLDKYINLRAHD